MVYDRDLNDYMHQGERYVGFPFEAVLPRQSEKPSSMVQLTVTNMDQRIVEAVRSVRGRPLVELFVVAEADDAVEAGPHRMRMANTTINTMTVSGDLCWGYQMNHTFPDHRFTPTLFPGLFKV